MMPVTFRQKFRKCLIFPSIVFLAYFSFSFTAKSLFLIRRMNFYSFGNSFDSIMERIKLKEEAKNITIKF